MLFQTSKSIIFRLGATQELGQIMARAGCKKVMIVTQKEIENAGLLADGLASLKAANIPVNVFNKTESNPSEENVMEATATAIDEGCDGFIGFGGGSSMDVAKVVSYLSKQENRHETLDDIKGVGVMTGQRLPLIQVPTTAGTGSEVTMISVVSSGPTGKYGVVGPQFLPDAAVLDGNLTLSVPKHVTAATGIDAMVHALEAYTSKILKNTLSDLLAKDALRILGSNIHEAYNNGSNAEARSQMLLGSMYAGMAFCNAPVGAIHGLAYPLSCHHGMSHGESNSVTMPAVMEFNAPVATKMYAEIAPYMFADLKEGSGTDDEITAKLVDRCKNLVPDLGIKPKLSQWGIKESDLDFLADEGLKQQRLLPNNPRHVTKEDAVDIYKNLL